MPVIAEPALKAGRLTSAAEPKRRARSTGKRLVPYKAVLGIPVCDLDAEAAIDLLTAALDRPSLTRVAFLNAHGGNCTATKPAFGKALQDFVVLPDGVGVDLAARVLSGARFRANLNGTDFVPLLVTSVKRRLSIGLIGAAPGVAERAAAQLQKSNPQHVIRVIADGFIGQAEMRAALDRIQRDPVDILLVGMGNPLQELFIADQIHAGHTRLAIGVGALFDFLAGEVPRAPLLMRRLRLEWLFRLYMEPRRLFRRYALGSPMFLFRVMKQKWSERGQPMTGAFER